MTDNRVRMLSASRSGGAVQVRVAHHLAALGDDAVAAVAGWVAGERGAPRRVRALLARAGTPPAPGTPPQVVIRSGGRHHDLAALAGVERQRYFPLLADIPVTWGARHELRPGQRSIRLGSYDFRRGLVRMHRVLDNPAVPAWFVGFVLFHELLHAELGAELKGRRRGIHTPEFRRREAQHHNYAEALAWEAAHLPRLLAGEL